ncbi:hypothetical protein QYM41_16415 [Kocuria sp. CPCC 205268]|uniref:hypothetical protein n=1 Tax=Kocuria oxytropis TaxID=3058913 RepID=UPI0034D3FD06
MSEERAMSEGSDEIADLRATVEEIRATKYPTLDQSLVNDILRVHQQYAEDRAEARKQTELLINRWAAAQPASEGR